MLFDREEELICTVTHLLRIIWMRITLHINLYSSLKENRPNGKIKINPARKRSLKLLIPINTAISQTNFKDPVWW